MSELQLSRAVGRAVQIEWFQAGEVERINCTGLTCAVDKTTLPFVPAISPIDLAAGRFRMEPFTEAQLDKLEPGCAYGLLILLRDTDGAAVEELELTIRIG